MTNRCSECVWWSEMIATSDNLGPIQAMCLNPQSSHRNTYTHGAGSCGVFEAGRDVSGAVDDPAYHFGDTHPAVTAATADVCPFTSQVTEDLEDDAVIEVKEPEYVEVPSGTPGVRAYEPRFALASHGLVFRPVPEDDGEG